MSFVKEDDVYQEFIKHIQDYMFNNTTICKTIENKIRENYNIKKNNVNVSQNKKTNCIQVNNDNNIIIPNLNLIVLLM